MSFTYVMFRKPYVYTCTLYDSLLLYSYQCEELPYPYPCVALSTVARECMDKLRLQPSKGLERKITHGIGMPYEDRKCKQYEYSNLKLVRSTSIQYSFYDILWIHVFRFGVGGQLATDLV